MKRSGVKRPGVKLLEGLIIREVNHIRRGEKKMYKGVNRPGVNHKRGETSGFRVYMYVYSGSFFSSK